MPELSPAASAIWEAFNQDEAGAFVDYGDKLAAALRAAAKQFPWDEGFSGMCCCEHLNAIADELEDH